MNKAGKQIRLLDFRWCYESLPLYGNAFTGIVYWTSTIYETKFTNGNWADVSLDCPSSEWIRPKEIKTENQFNQGSNSGKYVCIWPLGLTHKIYNPRLPRSYIRILSESLRMA